MDSEDSEASVEYTELENQESHNDEVVEVYTAEVRLDDEHGST